MLGVTLLAGLGWWSVLASERDALTAAQAGAKQAAAGTSLAIEQAVANGMDIEEAAALIQGVGDARLVVRDRDGKVLAGSPAPGAESATVRMAGGVTVSAEVAMRAEELGISRYGEAIMGVSVLVLGAAGFGLAALLRDRRRAHAELARLGRKFDEVAVVDELTGLGNRARLYSDLGTLVARGQRYGSNVGLAVFSIDGLEVSDAMVRRVSRLLASQARAADSCFRITPNRIAVVLAEQDELGAIAAAERIRSAVVLAGDATVSVGVTALRVGEVTTVEDLVDRAEIAVTQAAVEGGNRVVSALAPESGVVWAVPS